MLLQLEYTVPIVLGFLHLIIAALLLLSYRTNIFVNIYLIILLLIGALKSLSLGLLQDESDIFLSENFSWVRLALIFVVPASYLYLQTIIENKQAGSFRDIVHFISPVIWSCAIVLQSYYMWVPSNLWHTVRVIIISSYTFFYIMISIGSLKDFYRNSNQDNNQVRHFNSIKNWVVLFFIIITLIEIRALVHFNFNLENNNGMFFGVSIILNLLFLFSLVFKIISSPEILFGYLKLKKSIEIYSDGNTERASRNKINRRIIESDYHYYINDRPIEDFFEDKDLECLRILLNNTDKFLNINSFDSIFISQFKTHVITLKKRRQQSLTGIKFALSNRLGIPEESIYIYANDNLDKRIKLIKLNPDILSEEIY